MIVSQIRSILDNVVVDSRNTQYIINVFCDLLHNHVNRLSVEPVEMQDYLLFDETQALLKHLEQYDFNYLSHSLMSSFEAAENAFINDNRPEIISFLYNLETVFTKYLNYILCIDDTVSSFNNLFKQTNTESPYDNVSSNLKHTFNEQKYMLEKYLQYIHNLIQLFSQPTETPPKI